MFITSIISWLSSSLKTHTLDYYDALLPEITCSGGIQHNIFQTNRSKNSVKEQIRLNIEKIKVLNPDWEYHLYDDADIESFIRDYYGEVLLSFYNRISPEYGAAKADFFRYLVIYMFGGVYLDIKSSLNKPLSEVFTESDAYVLSYWDNLPGQSHEGVGHYSALPDYIKRGEIIQWYVAASAGHPLLRKIIATMLLNIDRYNPYINGIGWTGTVTTTGPVMYSKVIYDELNSDMAERYPVRWTDIIVDCGFQYSILESQNKSDKKDSTPLHTSLLPTDYRKAKTPVIKNKSRLIQVVNELYLSFLNARHNKTN